MLGVGQDFLQEVQIMFGQPFALVDSGLEFQEFRQSLGFKALNQYRKYAYVVLFVSHGLLLGKIAVAVILPLQEKSITLAGVRRR